MKLKLSKEERDLLRSVERGEWRPVTNKAELRKYREAARNTLKKEILPSSNNEKSIHQNYLIVLSL